MRALAVSLCVVFGLMGSTSGWSQFGMSERTGVVDKVELDAQSLIVSGLRYRVALDAHVEIDGSFGAYSMLVPGMKVRFECQVVSGDERIIVQLETLPSGMVLEEA